MIEEEMCEVLRELNEESGFSRKIGKWKSNMIQGKDALLVWQYVRFNQKYREQYRDAFKLANSMSDDRSEEYAPDIFYQLVLSPTKVYIFYVASYFTG